jgi:hypothetical protein
MCLAWLAAAAQAGVYQQVLIVEAGPELQANFKNNRAFSLISEVPKSAPLKRSKMWVALLITLAMVSTQNCRYSLFEYQVRATLWHYRTEAACDRLPAWQVSESTRLP